MREFVHEISGGRCVERWYIKFAVSLFCYIILIKRRVLSMSTAAYSADTAADAVIAPLGVSSKILKRMMTPLGS